MMKKILRIIVVATSIATGCLGLLPASWAAPSEASITAQQFREDLKFMRRTIAQTHPDLQFSTSPEALDKAIETLSMETDTSLTHDEAWRRLASLNPLFADGHLFVGFADWRAATTAHLQAGGTLFPYEVELSNDGLHIKALLGGADTALKGASIIAINGEPAEKITSALLQRMHGETPLFRAHLLAQRWWFYYWKMFGTAASYQLTISLGDHISTITTPASRQLPLLLQNEAQFEQQFRFAFQPDGSAKLTIASFAPNDREKFLAFTRDAFTQLQQAGTQLLTIDISANGGGDDASWLDGLMPYLATSSYRTGSTYKKKVLEANTERGELAGQLVTGSITTWHAPQTDNPLLFKGKTLVEIGPGTYSSAILFANVMRDFCFGSLTGKGGAARQTQSGGVRQFILPNSKLALWVARFVLSPPIASVPDALLEPATSERVMCQETPSASYLGR